MSLPSQPVSDRSRNYTTSADSERRATDRSLLLKMDNPDDVLSVIVTLLRRLEEIPRAHFERPEQAQAVPRPQLSTREFTARHGATSADVDSILKLGTIHNLGAKTAPSEPATAASAVAAETSAPPDTAPAPTVKRAKAPRRWRRHGRLVRRTRSVKPDRIWRRSRR